jgi:hypothetical protein
MKYIKIYIKLKKQKIKIILYMKGSNCKKNAKNKLIWKFKDHLRIKLAKYRKFMKKKTIKLRK